MACAVSARLLCWTKSCFCLGFSLCCPGYGRVVLVLPLAFLVRICLQACLGTYDACCLGFIVRFLASSLLLSRTCLGGFRLWTYVGVDYSCWLLGLSWYLSWRLSLLVQTPCRLGWARVDFVWALSTLVFLSSFWFGSAWLWLRACLARFCVKRRDRPCRYGCCQSTRARQAGELCCLARVFSSSGLDCARGGL